MTSSLYNTPICEAKLTHALAGFYDPPVVSTEKAFRADELDLVNT